MNRRVYTFGPFELDTGEQVLRRDGQPLPVKPKVFDLLVVLVENSGKILGKDELMKQVWAGSFVEDGNLAVSIVKLRQALGDTDNERRYIETVPRRGYRFVASVTQEAGDSTDIVSVPAAMPATSGDDVRPEKGTIAVLPFKLIGTRGDEYLGLGLADALITRLSNLRQVTVRPTSSIRKYEGTLDPVSVGKELRVEWVLEGILQKSGRRVRVTVQLVNVIDGAVRWAEKFDEKFTNIFEVEDSISEQVASTVAVKLSGEDRRLLAKRYTENPDAYEAYLKGRYFFEKRTSEGCQKGIDYFQQAIEADSNYALAYVGLADCYVTLANFLPSHECKRSAEKAALNALALDTSLAEAHASLGRIKYYHWDWLGAEEEFKRAIELNPNYASAHAWYAIHLVVFGMPDQALAEIKKAQALNPVSLIINSQIGAVLYLSRRYDEAVKEFRKTLEMDPDFAVAHFCLGSVYESQGKYENALMEYQRGQGGLGNPPEFLACMGRVYALTGKREQANQLIDKLITSSTTPYVQPNLIALIYAALGDKDQAFQWLERAYLERDEDLFLLKVDPRFDSLRDDVRFASLLHRVGLTSSDHIDVSAIGSIPPSGQAD